ncbi:MAG: efflux RND transporter periplasmic adaptor subunit [Phenylobacterium sp.]
MKKRLGMIAVGLAVATAVIAAWWFVGHRTAAPAYVTAAASTGPVSRAITASGSVNPVVTVQVGAFVSGNIQTLSCDFNTRVSKGQVCATIDPRPYQLIVDQDRAAVDTAKAQRVKDQASLQYAGVTYGRDTGLLKLDSIAREDVDNALSQRDQALAAVALDTATIQQRQAALDAAQVNLGYTRILSPVSGTVISRNVNIGQTVASSFQTPTLFLIAQDLTKMQVDTNVSESDIAGAVPGAAATFTVEAFPGRVFQGRVSQVRQAPVSVQNVITYDVVVAADNPDLVLKPGMTATAKIIIESRSQVLRVPAQALHFTPTATAARGKAGPTTPRVWVLRGKAPAALPVRTGLDDGAFVEITGGDLRAGDPVIVSAVRQARKAAAASPLRLGQ